MTTVDLYDKNTRGEALHVVMIASIDVVRFPNPLATWQLGNLTSKDDDDEADATRHVGMLPCLLDAILENKQESKETNILFGFKIYFLFCFKTNILFGFKINLLFGLKTNHLVWSIRERFVC